MAEESLELEPRKKIYDAIEGSPGRHLREIDRNVDIPLGTIRYHIRVLEKRDLIISKKEGKYKRYYPKGKVDREDKEVLAVLRKELPRTIILYILESPGSTHGDILGSLDVAASTLSYHLKKLREEGIVKKQGSEYYVKNEEKIADLLIQYQQTFLDSLVDRFVRMWNE